MVRLFKALIFWFGDRWHAKCRQIDLEVLWPICKEKSIDLQHAKNAFTLHAFSDDAWIYLGSARIHAIIDKLR